MSIALSIEELTVEYDKTRVLESLSFDVKSGEIICLLGASGCGKTTLLKAIAGLIPLSDGCLKLNNKVIDDGEQWLVPEQRNIGMIFQDYALFPHLTVEKNIAFGLSNLSQKQQRERVIEMLELVHLQGLENRYPHQLSGGQQQRVAIARALAYSPDLLLLDEPFSNIDTQVRHELISEIRQLFKQQGITAIFVTHSREEAFAFADKMAVMNQGVIEQYGSASELYYSPSSRFVADFLGGGSYLKATCVAKHQYDSGLGLIKGGVPEKEVSIGESCHLLFRPQHIQLIPTQTSHIHVLELQFLGDHCRYIIDVKGERLVATSSLPLVVGQSVNVEVDAESVLVFAQ
ncbi:ABC transporter ATP-binding protein [Vibrio sp. WJH972]